MNTSTQGRSAAYAGQEGESFATRQFITKGYIQAAPSFKKEVVEYAQAGLNWWELVNKPTYFTQAKVFDSIYNVPFQLDVLAFNPASGLRLAMEIKNQTTSGSVDEKFPFSLLSLQKFMSEDSGLTTVLALLGDGSRKVSRQWAVNSAGHVNVITSQVEYHTWCRRFL